MDALINPHFKHLKVTPPWVSQVASCTFGQGTQIHSVLRDHLSRLHNDMSNMNMTFVFMNNK